MYIAKWILNFQCLLTHWLLLKYLCWSQQKIHRQMLVSHKFAERFRGAGWMYASPSSTLVLWLWSPAVALLGGMVLSVVLPLIPDLWSCLASPDSSSGTLYKSWIYSPSQLDSFIWGSAWFPNEIRRKGWLCPPDKTSTHYCCVWGQTPLVCPSVSVPESWITWAKICSSFFHEAWQT